MTVLKAVKGLFLKARLFFSVFLFEVFIFVFKWGPSLCVREGARGAVCVLCILIKTHSPNVFNVCENCAYFITEMKGNTLLLL